MNFLLLGLSIFLIHAAEDLILPSDFERRLVYGQNQIGSTFFGDISYYYFTRPSLLAKRCNTIQYVQQVIDLAFGMSIEDYLLGKVDFRSRILWGNNQNTTSKASLELAGAKVSEHTHQILDNYYFWLREGWVDLDLSRFMCVNKSINLIMGRIPYSVGRGISYGVVFAESPGFIGNNSRAVIEEFAPAFLLTTEIFSNKNHTMFGDIYCAILNNYAGSYEQNIDPIYKSRIWHCPDEIERGFGHINFALIGRLKYEAINKYGVLNVEPYTLININPEASINLVNFSFIDLALRVVGLNLSAFDLFDFSLKDLNKSKLITIGCMTNWLSDRFSFNFEFAINKGGLESYGKDNNSPFIDNYFLEASEEFGKNSRGLTVNNRAVDELNFFIANNALVNEINQKIIESSPKGAEFNGDILGSCADDRFCILTNKYTRFINPKKFDYQGAMGVLDFAVWLKDDLAVAFTAGFATGGSFDIEQSGPEIKKFGKINTKYIPDYDFCGSYGGFISLQELYTGLWVKSAFGMGGPYPRSNESIFWNFNSQNINNLIFKELFNDLKFIGLSLNMYPVKNVSLKANILNYWSFCDPISLSVNSQDKSIKVLADLFKKEPLPKELGLEIYLVADVDFDYLSAFISWAIFFPGARFDSPDLNPVDYFDAYYLLKCVSFSEEKVCNNKLFLPDINKFNPSYLFNAGFEYTF